MTILPKPVLMGVIMGPTMLWMLHSQVTGDGMTSVALFLFLIAHIAVLAVTGIVAFLAARRIAFADRFLSRLHRPHWTHAVQMLASAAVAALAVHLFVHGGV